MEGRKEEVADGKTGTVMRSQLVLGGFGSAVVLEGSHPLLLLLSLFCISLLRLHARSDVKHL